MTKASTQSTKERVASREVVTPPAEQIELAIKALANLIVDSFPESRERFLALDCLQQMKLYLVEAARPIPGEEPPVIP